MHYKKSKIQLVAIDLDGTLLKDNKSISITDKNTINQLIDKQILCVAATGRSLHKVNEVLSVDIPFDYVVFSSGAGICDWKNKKILRSEEFKKGVAQSISKHLLKANLNFFVYRPIPHNNLFWYHQGGEKCKEFDNYLLRHKNDYEVFVHNRFTGHSGQIMAIIPNNEKLFEDLSAKMYKACNNIKIIRTTSPVNSDFIWMEIFPSTVSKGHGLQWLCNKLAIDKKHTVGIGNDYNDLDMFEFVEYPFLLSNGAEELKERFLYVDFSNEQNGVSRAIEQMNIL